MESPLITDIGLPMGCTLGKHNRRLPNPALNFFILSQQYLKDISLHSRTEERHFVNLNVYFYTRDIWLKVSGVHADMVIDVCLSMPRQPPTPTNLHPQGVVSQMG